MDERDIEKRDGIVRDRGTAAADKPSDRPENGRQALHALAERRPDIIVLDLMMPAMDGWEFRRLQREIHHDIPVLVISATSDPRLSELSADAFLTKPFDLDTFFVVLRGLLRRNGGELAS